MSTSTKFEKIPAGEKFIGLLESWRALKSQGDPDSEAQKIYDKILIAGRGAYLDVRAGVGELIERVDSLSYRYLALVFHIKPLELPISPFDLSNLSHELPCMKIIARLRQMQRLPSLYDHSESAIHYVEALYLEFQRVSGVVHELTEIYRESAEQISRTNILIQEKIQSIC